MVLPVVFFSRVSFAAALGERERERKQCVLFRYVQHERKFSSRVSNVSPFFS